jgi:hypothetical protein
LPKGESGEDQEGAIDIMEGDQLLRMFCLGNGRSFPSSENRGTAARIRSRCASSPGSKSHEACFCSSSDIATTSSSSGLRRPRYQDHDIAYYIRISSLATGLFCSIQISNDMISRFEQDSSSTPGRLSILPSIASDMIFKVNWKGEVPILFVPVIPFQLSVKGRR